MERLGGNGMSSASALLVDWEAAKEDIKHLYFKQNLPLREVRLEMRKHGLDAT